MTLNVLNAISPVDGRYHSKTRELGNIFSEYGLIKYRVTAEVRWLQTLIAHPQIRELTHNTADVHEELEHIISYFCLTDAARVKSIEATTNHDVKAVEYFLKERIDAVADLANAKEFIHFACTSEDINNVSYALMLKEAREQIWLPLCDQVIAQLRQMAHQYADVAMLSHTHGQAASPTTLGKEIANVVARLQRQRQQLADIQICAKMNGAVGNYNAHYSSYPDINWPQVAEECLESSGLSVNPYTTQIEPHDYIAELSHALIRCHNIFIDFARDTWLYISKGYFRQKLVEGEVGSSTMPHKVNPIDFENAEGNLGMANAVFNQMANQLTQSRLQRDLTDSTLLRNLGVGFAHSMIALKSLQKGISKLEVNHAQLSSDLDDNWVILGEALQTVMRRHGIANPYEQLKSVTRGQRITAEELSHFIDQLALPEDVKHSLRALRPDNYLGIAAQLAKEI